MNQFRTFIIVSNVPGKNIERINKLSFEEYNFSFSLKPEPSNQFYESKDGKSQHIIMGGYKQEVKIDYKNTIRQKELIINAENEQEAQIIYSTVIGLLHLGNPGMFHFSSVVYNKEDYCDFTKYKISDQIGFALESLKKIYELGKEERESIIYAIEKYKLSVELDTYNLKEFDPSWSRYKMPYPNKIDLKDWNTKSAFSINAAYSAIEELGLGIRASKTKPRKIKGEWNPDIFEELEVRLKKSKIEKEETIDWIFRGDFNKLQEVLKEEEFGSDSIFQKYGEQINDTEIKISHAIQYCSFLRNIICAHQFRELTGYLTPYEVINCQLLVRKIIILKLGMWGI